MVDGNNAMTDYYESTIPVFKPKDIILFKAGPTKPFKHLVQSKGVRDEVNLKDKNEKKKVPIWEKATLTLSEAAEYSNIGIHKLRELSDEKNCQFVLWNGNRRLIKRKQLDEFISSVYSI